MEQHPPNLPDLTVERVRINYLLYLESCKKRERPQHSGMRSDSLSSQHHRLNWLFGVSADYTCGLIILASRTVVGHKWKEILYLKHLSLFWSLVRTLDGDVIMTPRNKVRSLHRRLSWA